MGISFQFEFPLVNGLHARPASHLQAVAGRFGSGITLVNERSGRRANAKSVLWLVGTDTRAGDRVRVEIEGADEEAARREVEKFVREVLPGCDENIPAAAGNGAEVPLPRLLREAGVKNYLRGKPVCAGVGHGWVVMAKGVQFSKEELKRGGGSAEVERVKAESAIGAVGEEIRKEMEGAKNAQEVGVLKAHALIAEDVALREGIFQLIDGEHKTAAEAVMGAGEKFCEVLRGAGTAYLRERVIDVQDVCGRIVERILGVRRQGIKLTRPAVCVAERLTPGEFLAMDRKFLRGLVLGDGAGTSHTVILGRSMNVPTVVGVHAGTLANGTEAIVDGDVGLVVTELNEGVRRYYGREIRAGRKFSERLKDLAEGGDAGTAGIEIGANVASGEEVGRAIAGGAQGIGMFRTEMLFLDREAAPTEEEQTRIYSMAAEGAGGRSVIIRLLDIGGDKPAPYLELPREANPFLGKRGVRLYGQFRELVMGQIRAILRASLVGKVRILIPMVCCVEEVLEVKEMLKSCVQEVGIEQVPELGAMIEVPSAAFLMEEFAGEVDFFSIGSNDLIQYFLAADRGNEAVAGIYRWSHPAFLRLMGMIVEGAHGQGKWIGICGEMGESEEALPLLVGMGLDEISVPVGRVRGVRAGVGKLSLAGCRRLFEEAKGCGKREEVEELLKRRAGCEKAVPLVSPELVVTADGRTKGEIIRELSHVLHRAGRVNSPGVLEEAIWRREETYSTGFGEGFAIPHCKSDQVAASSIVIARLQEGVEWGSLDGRPVEVVILLAIREAEGESGQGAKGHMKVFSRLSRMVMREEFRQHIRDERDGERLVAFLRESLELKEQPCG